MKKQAIYIFCFLLVVPMICRSASLETNMCLDNSRSEPVLLKIGGIKNRDWDGSSRPDHVFEGKTIPAGERLCQRLEINARVIRGPSSSLPSFKIYVGGKKAKMEWMYSRECGDGFGCNPEWNVEKNISSLFDLSKTRENKYLSSYLRGQECSGNHCSSFTIK